MPVTTRIAWPINRELERCHPPEMLKPPWWTASLLLQHMVDELGKVSATSCRWSSPGFCLPVLLP